MAKADRKNSAAAFRSLEAKFAKLHLPHHHKTKEAAPKVGARIAKVEAQIKDICDLANSAEPGFGERFILLLSKQWRSSQDYGDYGRERDRLLVRLGEVSADKHRRTLEASRQLRAAFIVNRDRRMAEEFLRRKRNSSDSDSVLKAEIGERDGLGRSASIEAINRGLDALGLKKRLRIPSVHKR